MKTFLTAFILFSLFSLNIFADYPYIRFEGHKGKVDSLALSPDGNTIASGGWDNTVRLWDIAARKEIVTLTGHTGPVYSVALSYDGKMLASGSYDRTIRLWDVDTHTSIAILTEHKDAVSSLAFRRNGKILISGSYDHTIRLWDVETKTNIKTLTEHKGRVTSVVLSPDGKMFASSSWDKTVRLWDVETHTNITTFTEHTDDVMSVAFSPDGKTIAYGNNNGLIHLWEIATKKKIATLGRYGSTGNWIMSIAFSPDGKTIGYGKHSGSISIWDIATARSIGGLYDRKDRMDTVDNIVFSSNGKIIISSNWDSKVRLWNISRCFKITPYPIILPAIGEKFTINVEADIGSNLFSGYFLLSFDESVIRYVETTNGDLVYGSDTIETDFYLTRTQDMVRFKSRYGPGKGTLAKITFEVIDVKESYIRFYNIGHITTPYLTYGGKVVPPEFPSSAVVSITPSTTLSPAIGEQLVFNIDIVDGQNVARSELTLDFDQSALKHISSSEGNYFSEGVGNGSGTLETIIFEVLDVKNSTVRISGYLVTPDGFRYIPTFESAEIIEPPLGDVNRDGTVSILDLVQVASSLGQQVFSGGNPADVNGDGIVNIIDLVTVAGAINDAATAPAAWNINLQTVFTSDQMQKWLSQAQHLTITDTISQRGIRFLENLLALLTPKKTALLPNYPNPFNPETWIPYQLAESADVNISIYTTDGTVVRTLALGHQTVGIYHNKTRAAYWDGKNETGDAVASGMYFYTLTAGNFKSTRKMLILK
ncbi:MAG: dockerin type I domain-containing protein [Candidatus Poribacteria bacterium]|nr:dockerin type I domain-containing protein [Candidatus Poribacteria bacterium]